VNGDNQPMPGQPPQGQAQGQQLPPPPNPSQGQPSMQPGQVQQPPNQDQQQQATAQPTPVVPTQGEADTHQHEDVDLHHLPVGDGKVTTSGPQVGYVWVCSTPNGNSGASATGAWFNGDGTYDLTAKPTVDGAVTWPSVFAMSIEGGLQVFTGNGLPSHATGNFPISASDDAYQYDRNPNSISAQQVQIQLTANPTDAAQPSCLGMGPIGIMTSGALFFNALDAGGLDAAAHEIQDNCGGHPQQNGQYHYHSFSPCLADAGTGHSALIGYAFDGFGIYGPRGEDGTVLSNADLDECHGHSHLIEWNGQQVVMYHYHATYEYPYTLGCYHGTATNTGMGGAGGGGQPGGGPGRGPRP
jgi:hypothetical protein